MSTEIATRAEAQAHSVIQSAAMDLADAHKIGTALASTAFVPQHFKGKPEEAAAAILYGATIDMDPLTALQNIYVISGKPALYARSMVAVVLSKGHKIWTEEESDGSVTVAGQRKGSDQVERVTWTTEMAQKAGYTSNKKYQTDSRAMLYARASGDVARRIAPDALLGMAYSREELEMEPVAPRRSRVAAAIAEPEPETVEGEVVEPAEDLITEPQSKKLHALFNENGLDRAAALDLCSQEVGREITTTKQLTKAEASRIIDQLDMDPEGGE